VLQNLRAGKIDQKSLEQTLIQISKSIKLFCELLSQCFYKLLEADVIEDKYKSYMGRADNRSVYFCDKKLGRTNPANG
jgi:hypothetical protein